MFKRVCSILPGKRTPNKILRKSIEEKKNVKSSSEDDIQPEDKKDSKKLSPSKPKLSTKSDKLNNKAGSKTESENTSKKKKEDSETSSKLLQSEKKKNTKSGGPNSK